MPDSTISGLNPIVSVNPADLFVLEQAAEAKKMTAQQLMDFSSVNIVSASASSLPETSPPTASFNQTTKNMAFGIPKGAEGNGIVSVTPHETTVAGGTSTYDVLLKNGTTFTIHVKNGLDGRTEGASWGDITGTFYNQTDLTNAIGRILGNFNPNAGRVGALNVYTSNIDQLGSTSFYVVQKGGVTPGTYPSGIPNDYYYLQTFQIGNANVHNCQILLGVNDKLIYYRIIVGGTLRDWHKIYDDSDTILISNGGTGATSYQNAQQSLHVPGLDANGKVNPTQAMSTQTGAVTGGYLTHGSFNQVSTGTYKLKSTDPVGAEIEVYQGGGEATIITENSEQILSAAIGDTAVSSCTLKRTYGVAGFKHLSGGYWVATGDVEA